MEKMIDCISKIECTGCKMCADVCPVGAISYRTDREGFWYPNVDYNKCIFCKKCISTCPSLNQYRNLRCNEPNVYEAWNLDDEIRIKSTTGGLFYAFAQGFMEDGGVVVGCAYSNDYKSAKHIVAYTNEQLMTLVGSKYFQSDTAGVYKKVGELISSGKKVLFCGAPCQIAALYAYLGNEVRNLVTLDFVCRGINSPKVFAKYVTECENRFGAPVAKVQLKNKNKGWMHLGTFMEFKNGKKFYRDKVDDPWVNGFITADLFMRPCCSKCKYKEKVRLADISLGDFWGLEADENNLFKGISLVLVNTDKGHALLHSVEKKIYCCEKTYEEAIQGNRCLLDSAPMGKKRNEFFDEIDNQSFEKIVWKLIGKNKAQIFVMRVKFEIHNMIRRIKGNGHS